MPARRPAFSGSACSACRSFDAAPNEQSMLAARSVWNATPCTTMPVPLLPLCVPWCFFGQLRQHSVGPQSGQVLRAKLRVDGPHDVPELPVDRAETPPRRHLVLHCRLRGSELVEGEQQRHLLRHAKVTNRIPAGLCRGADSIQEITKHVHGHTISLMEQSFVGVALAIEHGRVVPKEVIMPIHSILDPTLPLPAVFDGAAMPRPAHVIERCVVSLPSLLFPPRQSAPPQQDKCGGRRMLR